MKNFIFAILASTCLFAVEAAECVDPMAIKIDIFFDDKCTKLDSKTTQENILSKEDAATFNDCHSIKLGNKKAYMQNLCLKKSFTI